MVVGRDDGRARVVVDVRDLRIDEQRDLPASRRLDDRFHHAPGDTALEVVGDHDGRRVGGALLNRVDDAAFGVAANFRVVFVIDARHLLIALGHDSHFRRRDAVGIRRDESAFDPGVAAALHQRLRVVILAGHGDKGRVAAQRGDVVSDVGRAANSMRLVIEHDDGDGRFGRDTRHAADDEGIEHRDADDENVRAGEGGNEPAGALSRERKQHGRRAPPRTAA